MLDALLQFVFRFKFIILFYFFVVIFLIIKRKQLAAQAKFILLYRTSWGLSWMEKFSRKFREWVVLFGYVGVGGGFIGLILISYMLIKNLYNLFASPSAAPGVSLVLPGIKIQGFGILPFWYWIIAIFIIAVIHEFSHGIVAKAHNIKVKNTGLVFLGPIIGAFVEPEEEKLQKEKDIVQYSIFAAGAFSNIILAVAAIALLNVIFMPLQQAMTEPAGFTFDSYYNASSPIAKTGIQPGTRITGIDDTRTKDFQRFSDQLICSKPGETVLLHTPEKEYPIILAESPDNLQRGFLGIKEIRNEFDIKDKYQQGIWRGIYYSLSWLTGFLRWLFLLSLGIGLFNLLPLPIVDGGRMAQVFLHRLKGEEKGEKRYRQISAFFLLILLLNLLFPFMMKIFY